MKITVQIRTQEILLPNGNSDGYETVDFSWEFPEELLKKELVESFASDYNIPEEEASRIVEDYDLWDNLEADYIDSDIKDILADKYYPLAEEAYKQSKA